MHIEHDPRNASTPVEYRRYGVPQDYNFEAQTRLTEGQEVEDCKHNRFPVVYLSQAVDLFDATGTTSYCLLDKEPLGGKRLHERLIHASIQNAPVIAALIAGRSSLQDYITRGSKLSHKNLRGVAMGTPGMEREINILYMIRQNRIKDSWFNATTREFETNHCSAPHHKQLLQQQQPRQLQQQQRRGQELPQQNAFLDPIATPHHVLCVCSHYSAERSRAVQSCLFTLRSHQMMASIVQRVAQVAAAKAELTKMQQRLENQDREPTTLKGREITRLLVHESSSEKANAVRLHLHKSFNMPYLLFLHGKQGKREQCLDTLARIKRSLGTSEDLATKELAKLVNEDHITIYSVHKFIEDNKILVDLFPTSMLEQ